MEPVMGECTEPSASTNRENREPERFRERGRRREEGRERRRRGQAKAGGVRLRLQLRLSEKRWSWCGEREYNGRFKYEPFKCCCAVRNIRQQHYAQKRKQPVKLNIYLSRCHFYIPMPLPVIFPARIWRHSGLSPEKWGYPTQGDFFLLLNSTILKIKSWLINDSK